jgi:hypothetical protein
MIMFEPLRRYAEFRALAAERLLVVDAVAGGVFTLLSCWRARDDGARAVRLSGADPVTAGAAWRGGGARGAVIIPNIAVQVRRLHDSDRSGGGCCCTWCRSSAASCC